MIRRLYIHNFRCLENFDLKIGGLSSVLLIGKNGTGKSTVAFALEILRKIAQGTTQVSNLVKSKDFSRGRSSVPMRFEIEIQLESTIYDYTVAFELPDGYKDLLIFDERLTVNGEPFYTRELGQVHLFRKGQEKEAALGFDRNVVALPILQPRENDPLFIFRNWLAQMIIVRPVPTMIMGESEQVTLWPNPQIDNFGAWFSGLLAYAPAAYNEIDRYLKQVMPDLKVIKNPPVGKSSRSLVVEFSKDQASVAIPFEDLSDGEKCFMICAVVLAANNAYGPLLCFWDEPDNYIAPDEVSHFVRALSKAFQSSGQFIATSHNPEAILRFSDESTLVLSRSNYFEPTQVRPLSELSIKGDLATALVLGDVEP